MTALWLYLRKAGMDKDRLAFQCLHKLGYYSINHPGGHGPATPVACSKQVPPLSLATTIFPNALAYVV